jgi:hypothetical protein
MTFVSCQPRRWIRDIAAAGLRTLWPLMT